MPKISSGCNTCRRRKKGCDLQQPSCGQCLKIGVPCGGYDRQAKFIHVTPAGDVAPASSPSGAKRASRVNAQPDGPANSVSNGPQHGVRDAAHGALVAGDPVLTRQPDFCALSTWNMLLECSQGGSLILNDSPFTGWMLSPPSLKPSDQTLRYAVTALTLSTMGRSTRSTHLVGESHRCYLLALGSLQKTLAKGTSRINDESLAGVMFLSLFEVIEGSAMRGLGWTSHTDAATHLVRKRGHTPDSSDFRKKLVLGLRVLAVIRAISCRQPAALDSPEWTPIPSSEKPIIANYNRLLDLMAKIPSILSEIDSIRHCGVFDLHRINEVSKGCCALVSELRVWHASFQAERGGIIHWDEPSTLETSNVERFTDFQKFLFSTCICYPHPDIAQMEILYWTAELVITNNLWMTYKALEAHGLQMPSDVGGPVEIIPEDFHDRDGSQAPFQLPALPLNVSEAYTFSTNIARSMEFFVKPQADAIDVTRIAFPVTVAVGFFDHFNLPEIEWFRLVFDHIKSTSGIDLKGFLDEVTVDIDAVIVG